MHVLALQSNSSKGIRVVIDESYLMACDTPLQGASTSQCWPILVGLVCLAKISRYLLGVGFLG
jgi:hypothetical protein